MAEETTENLCDIGAGDCIVGISGFIFDSREPERKSRFNGLKNRINILFKHPLDVNVKRTYSSKTRCLERYAYA